MARQLVHQSQRESLHGKGRVADYSAATMMEISWMAAFNRFWRFDSYEEWVFEAYSVDAAGRLESTRGHIVPCQGKADSFLDLAPMPGNCLQSFVDRSVEILLAASSTHPGWYAIHIDRLAFEMKPGTDHTLVYFPLAEFAQIWCRRRDHWLSEPSRQPPAQCEAELVSLANHAPTGVQLSRCWQLGELRRRPEMRKGCEALRLASLEGCNPSAPWPQQFGWSGGQVQRRGVLHDMWPLTL